MLQDQDSLAFRRFRARWRGNSAAWCGGLQLDLPELLSFFAFPRHLWRKLRTTNVIERCSGQALPGISEEEAATIVQSELGLGLSQRKVQKLISKSRITDLRNGGQHSYVSARRLFWVIRELQAVAIEEEPKGRADSFRAADD